MFRYLNIFSYHAKCELLYQEKYAIIESVLHALDCLRYLRRVPPENHVDTSVRAAVSQVVHIRGLHVL